MPKSLLRTDNVRPQDQDISAVFERYADTVFRLAFARTKSRQDAEDIVQEVFLKYLRAATEFDTEEHRKAWLLRVTINCSKNLLGSAWFRHFASLPDTLATEMRQTGQVYGAVMALPAGYRTVIHLHYYEGYSVAEIAYMTGAKESTVKSRLHRARRLLRAHMEGEEDLV